MLSFVEGTVLSVSDDFGSISITSLSSELSAKGSTRSEPPKPLNTKLGPNGFIEDVLAPAPAAADSPKRGFLNIEYCKIV